MVGKICRAFVGRFPTPGFVAKRSNASPRPITYNGEKKKKGSQLRLLALLQLGHDGGLQALGLGGGGPTLLDLAVAADEEFFEIPLDPLHAQDAWFLLLHPVVQRLGFVAVDLGLAQYGECDAVVGLAELLDRVVVPGVLVVELVARHAEDDERVPVRRPHAFVQLF